MDELDRYLKTEYRDADFRRYQVLHPGKGPVQRVIGLLAKLLRAMPARALPGISFLNPRQVLVWNLASYSTLTCLEGSLWLTRTKDPKDYFLRAGQSMVLPPGQWIAQAFERSQMERKARFVTKEVGNGKATVLPVLQRL